MNRANLIELLVVNLDDISEVDELDGMRIVHGGRHARWLAAQYRVVGRIVPMPFGLGRARAARQRISVRLQHHPEPLSGADSPLER